MDTETTKSTNNVVNEEESSTPGHDAVVAAATAATTTMKPTSDELKQDEKEEELKKPSKDDLIELIRAIKFAKPDASQSQVHKEITMELSTKSPPTGESYEFLKNVHIHDVKKVWKKALIAASASAASNSNNNNVNTSSSPNQDLKEQLQSSGGPVQVFTVGNNNTVQHLAKEYTAKHIASQIAPQEKLHAEEEKERLENYVYVFLNVPADKSGSRPHQGLIHFPSNKSATTTSDTTKNSGGSTTNSNTTTKDVKSSSGGNKKKSNKKKKGGGGAKSATNATTAITATNDNDNNDKKKNDIVKIQMVSQADGDPSTKYPMLVYNKSRTCRTFIHPTDDGYSKIQEWIIQQGIGGSLGATGGTKAYFYSNVLSYSNKKGSSNVIGGGGGANNNDDILQIQITELAPNQEW